MDYPFTQNVLDKARQLIHRAGPALQKWLGITSAWKAQIQQQFPIPTQLVLAETRDINAYVTERHYLHRGRTMAQCGYWVVPAGSGDVEGDPVTRSPLPGLWTIGEAPILGAIHFAYPRVSQRVYGYPPMQTLELARLYIEPLPSGQNPRNMASAVVGAAIKRVREDWADRYPNMPEIQAIVSYSDTVHHEGTIYKAANFIETMVTKGTSGKTRRTGPKHEDLTHPKQGWMYPYSPADPRKKLWYVILWENPMPRRAAKAWQREIADMNPTLPIPKLFVSADGVEMHIDISELKPDTFAQAVENLGISVYESMLQIYANNELEGVDIEGIQATVEIVEVIPANWERGRKTGRWSVVEKSEATRSIFN